MVNSDQSEGLQQRQDIDTYLRWISTTLGFMLVIGVLVATILYINDNKNFPKPKDLEAGVFFGFGLFLIIFYNFPWAKIRIGDVEIERAIEETEKDHAEEIARLKSIIETYESSVEQNKEIPGQISAKVKIIMEKKKTEDQDEKRLLSFLQNWPSWGFTATRIKNWGGDQPNYECLGKLSTSDIRFLAGNLIAKGDVRTRVSSNGNILYQAKNT